MTQTEFEKTLCKQKDTIERIREKAHKTHDDVNQKYGKNLPYGYHLDMVADEVIKYGHLVCEKESDIPVLIFGAYFHDSIEDARLTYNDVKKICASLTCMNDTQIQEAAEIVFALTNDKGRNREERAGEKYYRGIRCTPLAPFVKMCDRMANIRFSCNSRDSLNNRMRSVYIQEMPHFLDHLRSRRKNIRFSIPEQLVEKALRILEK